MDQQWKRVSAAEVEAVVQDRRAYTGSAINHPDATPEFKNRTIKRRAKNRVAKQSRKKNR